jgi:aspartate racemase
MQTKKKLGIIGGMGSRAGVVFLKKIIDYSPAGTDQEFLEIIFHNNSAIPDRTRAIVYNEASPLTDILKSIDLFNQNKVEAIVLACITSYYYFDQLKNYAKARILNPLDLINEYIKEEYPGTKRVGVLATTGTINSGLFRRAVDNFTVEIVTLKPRDQESLFMRSVYMAGGFKSAVISGEARDLMTRSVEKLINLKVDLIIGGCTEVSIGINPRDIKIPFIDILDLLARKTVAYCYNMDLKYITTAKIYG